jgi:hypothetical protein
MSMLLHLPREIRDLIYEHVLIRDAINIECAVVKPFAGQVSRAFDDLKEFYPLRASRQHRRVWLMPASDLDSNCNDQTEPAIYMTYQLTKKTSPPPSTEVNLGLLRVCKQIHAEAHKIFYSGNVFSFTGDYRIPTAFAFLCDRPPTSLLLIRSLELLLMEANNTRGSPGAHYPVIQRSAVPLLLQYAYNYFTDLCTLLSTSRVQLQKLYLTVETMNMQEAGFSRQSLQWETNSSAGSWAFLPAWFYPLLNIQGLETVELCWISHRPRLQLMAYTVRAMQRHMLANNGAVGLTEDGQRPDPWKFRMLHKTEDERFSSASLIWEDLVLDIDGLSDVNQGKDDKDTAEGYFRTRSHIEWTLGSYLDAYACYCRLERA